MARCLAMSDLWSTSRLVCGQNAMFTIRTSPYAPRMVHHWYVFDARRTPEAQDLGQPVYFP
jgi:hypothetical protein